MTVVVEFSMVSTSEVNPQVDRFKQAIKEITYSVKTGRNPKAVMRLKA